MIDWQERVFQVLVDPDSPEADAAQAQLFGALHDGDSAWHTRAVEILFQLYQHFSVKPHAEPLSNHTFQMRRFDGNWRDDMDAMSDEAAYSRYGW